MLTILAWIVFVLSSAWNALVVLVLIIALLRSDTVIKNPVATISRILIGVAVWVAAGIYIFGV